jgi:hypothetical protein
MLGEQPGTRVWIMMEAHRETKRIRDKVEENIREPVEEATRLGREQIQAGERTAQMGVDLLQTSFDLFQRNVAATMGFVAETAQRSTHECAQLFDKAGDKSKRAAEQTPRTLTGTAGNISNQWLGFARQWGQRNIDHWNLLIGCRTPQELIEAQSKIFSDNVADLALIWRLEAERSARVGEIAARSAKRAAKMAEDD